MVRLPLRLQTVYRLVPPEKPMVDIGTDHAFLPIELVRSGRVPSALAFDVRKGPLKIAGEHIRSVGLSDRIQTRLSDGFAALNAGEAETAVIAGMGGGTIRGILERKDPREVGIRTLILGPQSEEEALRFYLQAQGYLVYEERYVEEEGKIYGILAVRAGKEPALSETEARFGRVALNRRDPVLRESLEKKERIYREILAKLPENEAGTERRKELEEELSYVKEAQKRWKEQDEWQKNM